MDKPTNTTTSGRKLAIDMLREAYSYHDQHADDPIDRTSIEARFRRGQPQDNYIAKYLVAVADKPKAAEGLASVLSDMLASGSIVDPVVYVRADRQLRRREQQRIKCTCTDPRAFPLVTAMQACVESAQRACEAADLALEEAMRAAG